MSAVEKFEYQMTVVDNANAAIKQTGDNAATLGGKATIAAKGIDALNASTKVTATTLAEGSEAAKAFAAETAKLTTATDSAAKGTETFRQRVNKLPDVLGKQAAAISLVSSSLAESNGNVGKAVAGAGQMAAAYGAGGPWALALVGGMALVAQFSSYLVKLNEEQDRAIAAQYASVDALTAKKAAVANRVAALQAQVDPEGARRAALVALEADIAAAQDIANAAKANVYGKHPLIVDAQEAATALATRKAEAANAAQIVDLLLKEYELTIKINAADKPAAPTRHVAAVKKEEEFSDDSFSLSGLTLDDVRDEERQHAEVREATREQARKASLAAEQSYDAQLLANKVATDSEIERQAQESYARQLSDTKAFHEAGAQYAMQATSIVAGAFNQLVTDRIEGEEHATERFFASIMQQAGQVLVGEGIKLGGIATVSALTGNPLAIPQGLGAAGLIASGVALGGVATGIMHTAAGGKIGQALPEEKRAAQTSKGTGSLGGSGSRTGGGTNITIIYGGVSGPEAESGARALAAGLQLANSRGRITKRIERR